MNLSLPGGVVRFYNDRGTAEQWIKLRQAGNALHWLSCHRFRANERRSQLSLLTYNLGELWRRLVLLKRYRPLVADELGVALVKRATNQTGFDKPEGPNSFPVRRAS
jgi:hypothetical protein